LVVLKRDVLKFITQHGNFKAGLQLHNYPNITLTWMNHLLNLITGLLHMKNQLEENGPIDLEYDYINENKRIGKEIDKENRILQEKYKF